jgi:hypothetical protein
VACGVDNVAGARRIACATCIARLLAVTPWRPAAQSAAAHVHVAAHRRHAAHAAHRATPSHTQPQRVADAQRTFCFNRRRGSLSSLSSRAHINTHWCVCVSAARVVHCQQQPHLPLLQRRGLVHSTSACGPAHTRRRQQHTRSARSLAEHAPHAAKPQCRDTLLKHHKHKMRMRMATYTHTQPSSRPRLSPHPAGLGSCCLSGTAGPLQPPAARARPARPPQPRRQSGGSASAAQTYRRARVVGMGAKRGEGAGSNTLRLAADRFGACASPMTCSWQPAPWPPTPVRTCLPQTRCRAPRTCTAAAGARCLRATWGSSCCAPAAAARSHGRAAVWPPAAALPPAGRRAAAAAGPGAALGTAGAPLLRLACAHRRPPVWCVMCRAGACAGVCEVCACARACAHNRHDVCTLATQSRQLRQQPHLHATRGRRQPRR